MPYIQEDGTNYNIKGAGPLGGISTLQFPNSASSFTQVLPERNGTLASSALDAGVNSLTMDDMGATFRALDALVMPSVDDYLVNTPPEFPADGYTAIIGPVPTGAWADQGGRVARWSEILSAYEFYTPKNGWVLASKIFRESYRYAWDAWEIFHQEGSWTPQVVGETTPGSQTYSLQSGNYVVIGQMCYAFFNIELSAFSGAVGDVQISGLPFTVSTRSGAIIGSVGNITFPSGCTAISCYASAGGTDLKLAQVGSGIGLNLDSSAITATTYLSGIAIYATSISLG